MNCKEFDFVVNGLALAKLMDAAEREHGLAHAEGCGRCAVRLADERALVAGLKALAVDAEDKAAPLRIEAALLAAFRQQPIQAKTKLVRLPIRQRRIRMWSLAAAAVLLVVCAVAALQLREETSSRQPKIALSPSPAASPRATPPTEEPSHVVAEAEIAEPNGKPLPKPRKKQAARQTAADQSSVMASIGEFTLIGFQETEQEVATDFLPLFHYPESQPLESGQVIRIQMPRSTLASFGLPINPERANVPVKADVLLAEDGSARAIRFIR